MLKTIALTVALGMGAAQTCTVFPYFLKGEEIEPGVYRVLRASGSHNSPAYMMGPFDTLANSRVSDLKAHLTQRVLENNLVFIGQLDSVIEDLTYGQAPPSGPYPVPAIILTSHVPPSSANAIYLRLKIDTLIKGSLPSHHFWVQSHLNRTTCGENFSAFKSLTFLNFSDALDTLSDLKLNFFGSSCSNCPSANTFDGRYVRSPDFPVLKIDIREVLPGYPVSLRPTRGAAIVPWRLDGKAYRPDGRTVPEGTGSDRKSPVPLLK